MTAPTTPGPMALGFFDVSFSYDATPVLEAVNFHLHGGEFAVLIGPNGAGKTTILRLLLGLARPESGRVEILGQDPEAARSLVGYVPQHADWDKAFPISVEEVVRMGRLGIPARSRAADRQAVASALAQADVADLARRPYTALSGGQRRRVLIARALAAEPCILVLDEPTANMDTESETRLYQTLGRLKGSTTILMVTHDSGFVSALTDVVLCVGERSGPRGGSSVVRHASVPATHAPVGHYGGPALRVLHDQDLPDDHRCADCGHQIPPGGHP